LTSPAHEREREDTVGAQPDRADALACRRRGGIDQLIKWLVETRLPFHELVPVIPMLGLYRTWNEGIAFSLLKGLPDSGLLALTAVVIVFVLYLWWRTPGERGIAHLGFALIIGGALGNLIDRAVYGHVVDYILFHTSTWSFAVFNLADSFISIGAGLIVLDEVIATCASERRKSNPIEIRFPAPLLILTRPKASLPAEEYEEFPWTIVSRASSSPATKTR
jgi:signal peptidase II